MPTITFAPEDLNKLVGQKLDTKKLDDLFAKAKAEYELLTNEMTVKFNDTNQPYLWSPEGLARLFKGILGKQKGIPKLKLGKQKETIIYDKKLSKIRPYIACFTATGKKIDEYLLKQIIQLQEKLAENFGRKRQKISIGVYPLNKITFPITCRAASPSEKFTPLDFHNPTSLRQTLETHPKGKEYGHLIKDFPVYPVFSDAKKEIMSLIPVINSEQTGRLQPGDDALFFDTTGTDWQSVDLAANIFAYALAERGFTIQPIAIKYPNKTIITPTLKNKQTKIKEEGVEKLLGIKLNSAEIKKSLEAMGYEYNKGNVTIPSYRHDIMHQADIIEDVAIAYGYDKITELPLTSYTTGGTTKHQQLFDTHRTLWTGLGYQETMSAVLCNKQLLYEKTNSPDLGTINIENPVSLTYSCVRTWILPQLLEFLSKNKHVDYPQKIFEEGIITLNKKQITDEHHIAATTSHGQATFTEIKQAIESVLRNTGKKPMFEEYEHPSFIPGRAAKILVDKKEIGYLGEFSPAVLEKFGILQPTAGCEINLSLL